MFGSARKVFEKMTNRSVVSWATIIGAYGQWDQPHEAIKLFRKMEMASVNPNEITLVNVLTACAKSRNLETAEQVHKYIDEIGMGFQTVLTAALMDVYYKCGCYPLARDLFDEMPEKNLFCWNIMIRRE